MDDFDNLRDDFDFSDSDFNSSPSLDDSPDEFDQLRRSSARSETMFNELTEDGIRTSSSSSRSSGFSMSNFTPGQRVILAALVVLNLLVISIGLMVVLGVIGG